MKRLSVDLWPLQRPIWVNTLAELDLEPRVLTWFHHLLVSCVYDHFAGLSALTFPSEKQA